MPLYNPFTVGSAGIADASIAIADASTAFVDAGWPWVIDLAPWGTASAHTNWSGNVATAGTIGPRWYSSAAQNDMIAWDIPLAAGTYTVTLIHYTGSDNGIYTVKFDATTLGTIDGYTAGAVPDTITLLTGKVNATTAKVRLSLNMLTKNGSSSGYRGQIQWVRVTRTA